MSWESRHLVCLTQVCAPAQGICRPDSWLPSLRLMFTTKCSQVAVCSLYKTGTMLPHLPIIAIAVGAKLHGVASEDISNILRQVWIEKE